MNHELLKKQEERYFQALRMNASEKHRKFRELSWWTHSKSTDGWCRQQTARSYWTHSKSTDGWCRQQTARSHWTHSKSTDGWCRQQTVLGHIESRKLRYFMYVIRLPYDSIESSMMRGFVEGVRGRERPRICSGLTTSWHGLACQRSACYTRETVGIGHCLCVCAANHC